MSTRGPWQLAGAHELFPALAAELERHATAGTKWRARLRLGAEELYLKGSPLAPWPALRHALRRTLLCRPEPRLSEFANLTWLTQHGFRAVQPRLAGVRRAGPLVRYQFLATRLEPAPRLDEYLGRATPAARQACVELLAATLARLHGAGFVHRDLFARNLLVSTGPRPEPIFLDAWRGGPRPGLRGPLHDLACLMLDGATLFTPAEQRVLFATYRNARGAAAGPQLEQAVARARARLVGRERTRHPHLAPEWNFPEPG